MKVKILAISKKSAHKPDEKSLVGQIVDFTKDMDTPYKRGYIPEDNAWFKRSWYSGGFYIGKNWRYVYGIKLKIIR